jgi:hypothetical protein
MKKIYQAPESRCIALYVEGALMSASKIEKQDSYDGDVSGSDSWTRRHSWSSENWEGEE